jgi:acyl carrier protein
MDSLMAVELRNKLRKDLAVDVSVVKFLDNLSIAVLAQEISQQWSASEATQPIEQAATASISEENAVELLANLESLTDAEIDALLNATFLTST